MPENYEKISPLLSIPQSVSLNISNYVVSWILSTKTAASSSAFTPSQRSARIYVPAFDIARRLVDPSLQNHCKRARHTNPLRSFPHHRLRYIASTLIGCLQSHSSILQVVIDKKEKKPDVKPIVGHRICDVLAYQSFEAGVLPHLKKIPTPEPEISIQIQDISDS